MNPDEDHLRLLSIFHYVVGGLAALFSLFPAIYIVMGLVFIFGAGEFEEEGGPPPEFMGWFFVAIGAVMMAIGLGIAGCIIGAGRCIARRRRHLFCLVIAGIECLFMPFGTVLGVFTLIVLLRESVKEMFLANQAVDAG
jgi:hypothetical protein